MMLVFLVATTSPLLQKSLPLLLATEILSTLTTMSSLRNAAPRRPHRERSQPQSRQKWGLLEKHKDYSLRAADYNLKKRKLSQLAQKARERHPDEFAFGMVSSGTDRAGKHGQGVDRAGGRLSVDAAKLLKDQDAGYLRVVAARGRKEIENIVEDIGVAEGTKGIATGKKLVFDQDGEAVKKDKKRIVEGETIFSQRDDLENASPEATADTDIGMSNHHVSTQSPKRAKAREARKKAIFDLRRERRRRKLIAEARANKLETLKKRQKEIMAVADQLDLQRAKMARTVGGINKSGVKFKIRERRR